MNYIVKDGDTIQSIANNYGITTIDLESANEIALSGILVGQELYIPCQDETVLVSKQYVVENGDSLWSIAKQFGLSSFDLKQANGILDDVLFIGQELIIPYQEFTKVANYPNVKSYTVQQGDTINQLSDRYNFEKSLFLEINKLQSDQLIVGQVVLIPQKEEQFLSASFNENWYTVQSGDTLWKIANAHGVEVSEIKLANNLFSDSLQLGQLLKIPSLNQPVAESSINEYFWYTVKSGDSLYQIARKYQLPVNSIVSYNSFSSTQLSIGQMIKIPLVSTTTSSNPTSNSGSNSSSTTNANTSSSNSVSQVTTWREYTVQAGDSLFAIARKFDTTTDKLIERNLLLNSSLSIGQNLWVPFTEQIVEETTSPNNPPSAAEWYTVRSGDTLSSIAWLFDTTAEAILYLNGMIEANLFIGLGLKVIRDWNGPENGFVSTGGGQLGSPSTTPSDDFNSSVSNTNSTNSNSSSPNSGGNISTESKTYIVVAGDSLWKIAQENGVSVDEIKAANPGLQNSLSIGQLILIPDEKDTSSNTNIGSDNSHNAFSVSFEALTLNEIIQSGVGKGQDNLSKDVGIIQQKLLQLGYLDPMVADTESISNDGNFKVAETKLIGTIQAIERFQNDLQRDIRDFGFFKPNSGGTDWLLTSANSNFDLLAIEARRATIDLLNPNRELLFSGGLKGEVGDTWTGNNPEDLVKVQQVLIDLDYLSPWHGETFSGLTVPNSKIPLTIRAIKRFQDEVVKFWIGKSQVNFASNFSPGIIKENDLTFQILKTYKKYKLSFSHPNSNEKVSISFKNYVKSAFTENINGISYWGKLSPTELSIADYLSLGLNHSTAKALKYVSEHEGNFDAINSYDKAIISFGFIQFAGGNRGLSPMLSLFKHKWPNKFKELFKNFGIDVEYNLRNGKVNQSHLAVVDTNSNSVLRGEQAEKFIQSKLQLIGVFIRSAYDRSMQLNQVRSAKRRYVDPALTIKFDLNLPIIEVVNGLGNLQRRYSAHRATDFAKSGEYFNLKDQGLIREARFIINNEPITNYLKSEMAHTVLIDLTVNQWIQNTKRYFEFAFAEVIASKSFGSKSELMEVNERLVLQALTMVDDARASQRTQNILNQSGLSST